MRCIVITGASSGIGAALAHLCAERGWNVVAASRRGPLAIDVTARDAPQRIVAAALAAHGRIDAVVNNAGVAQPGLLLEQPDAAIESQWQLHVAAPLRIARAALPHLRETRGGLVFIGSGLARVPAPRYGAYAPAKAAIRAAATQLRRELKPEGVFVTYVDPGVVDTNFSAASGMEPQPAWWHATPEGVARHILRGIERRAARVNAVWWQTAGTVFGEWFPSVADAAMSTLVTPPTQPPATPESPPAPTATPPGNALVTALEPVRRRMERVNLSETFVRDLLVPENVIELHDVAMRWAGMPNKNERAAMREVLDALAAAGFLQPDGEEQWKVLRAAPPA